jgi:ubiquitin C-terminal hydrolase
LNQLALTSKLIIDDLFKSELTRFFECSSCMTTSTKQTKNSIYCMNLPDNKGSNLLEALRHYTNDLKLNESCCLSCPSAETRIRLKFSKLCKILIIRLKSSLDSVLSINYSIELNLKSFTSESVKQNVVYNLINIVCYNGNSRCGHCM